MFQQKILSNNRFLPQLGENLGNPGSTTAYKKFLDKNLLGLRSLLLHFSPNGMSFAQQDPSTTDVSKNYRYFVGKHFKILLFSLFVHYSPNCFLLFVDYHWFLFILFEILKINT